MPRACMQCVHAMHVLFACSLRVQSVCEQCMCAHGMHVVSMQRVHAMHTCNTCVSSACTQCVCMWRVSMWHVHAARVHAVCVQCAPAARVLFACSLRVQSVSEQRMRVVSMQCVRAMHTHTTCVSRACTQCVCTQCVQRAHATRVLFACSLRVQRVPPPARGVPGLSPAPRPQASTTWGRCTRAACCAWRWTS